MVSSRAVDAHKDPHLLYDGTMLNKLIIVQYSHYYMILYLPEIMYSSISMRQSLAHNAFV